MANTLEHEVTQDEWTLVVDGSKNVAIQLAEQGQVRVHVGEDTPDASAAGILLARGSAGLPPEFSASGLGDGVKVWIRANEDDAVNVVVLQY